MSIHAADQHFIIGIFGSDSSAAQTPLLAALRAPAFLPAFLFENHYALWASAVGIGVVLFFIARSRADGRILRGSQVLLACTLLWIIAAFALDTAGERLHAAHLGIAHAVEKADVDAIFSYFDPSLSISDLAIHNDDAGKKAVGTLLKERGLKEIRFTAYHVDALQSADAMTRITVIVTSDFGPLEMIWRLSWHDAPDADWELTRAAYVPPQGMQVNPSELVK